MKVYIVYCGYHEDKFIRGIFSSKEIAEKVVAIGSANDYSGPDEFEVDECLSLSHIFRCLDSKSPIGCDSAQFQV